MTRTADIIVIGGGIAGISAAAELARNAQVIVLEGEEHLGYHATGRSAAIYIRNYGNSTLRALNAIAYPALSGELLGESVLSPRGEMLLAEHGEEDVMTAYLAEGEGIDRLTAKEAKALVPVLKSERIAAAAIEREAQDIDVDMLLQGYARLCRERGGTILSNQSVSSITRQGGNWTTQTATESFEAPILVNAAGAWADHIAGLAGVRPVGLQPMRRSAVLMGLPAALEGHQSWPLFGSVTERWYAKPMGQGLMISPADEDPVAPQDAWPDDMVLAEGLYRFEQMVEVPIVRPSHSWAGLRSFVADRTPVCGFAPDADGFFWLAGQGGYGVQTSAAMAELSAALCFGRADRYPSELIAALGAARFN